MVPNLDISSRSYYKVLATLSKQVPSMSSIIKLQADVMKAQSGLEHLSVISDSDRLMIQRARDLFREAVVAEIIDEDPKSLESYHNALRHQIVVACQRLRAYLALANHLMDTYNASVASSKGKARASI